jgi:hypothetical protein
MKVIAKYSDCKSIKDIEKFGCFRESEIDITKNKGYEVHAVIFHGDIPYLQIINDVNCPVWLASVFFEISNTSVPNDWICNIASDEDDQPVLIIGPEFIARDVLAYDRMVELEPEAVTLFWERIKRLESHE